MCPGKVPTLVSWLGYESGQRDAKIYRALRWLPRSVRLALENGPLADRKQLQAETAQIALTTLGPELGDEAASAMPQLAKLVNSTNDVIAERATSVAERLGTNGLAILLPVAADESNPRHHGALVAIDFMFYLGTNGSPALPTLVRCTQSKDPKTVRIAAQALGHFKIQPATSVPALVAVLSNSDPKARAWAAAALGRFGPTAKPATPSLIQILLDPALEPRQEATNALRKIAPEVLANDSTR
jgi:HEAT repeat protein